MSPLFSRSGKDNRAEYEEQSSNTRSRRRRSRTPEPKDATESGSEQSGLFELWPNSPPGESEKIPTTLDIVAIHGLGGHPYQTWTEGQRLWLRDFVPKAVPEARIFTFGYNSAVAFSGSASRIDDFAQHLLERLVQKRRAYRNLNRPIIFVAHSLGGIVFKKALVIAHERGSRYQDLSASVKSVIFMGVPHRGADIAFWSTALGRIANMPLLGRLRTDLLNDLTPKSDILGAICDQFVERGKNLQIFSLYERQKISPLSELVVDKSSAVLHLPNETPLPVEANHTTMVKFLTSSSEAYATVFDCLKELIDAAQEEDDAYMSKTRESFLKSLIRFDPRTILHEIPTPCRNSCDWILDRPEFRRWMAHASCRILWLFGVPGIGKTVMSRYLNAYLKQRKAPTLFRPIVSFFFCDNKVPERKTSLALLRSILFQILQVDQGLLRYIDDDAMESHLNVSNDSSVQPDTKLWDSLVKIIQRSRDREFWVVIDALDELVVDSRNDVLHQIQRIIDEDLNGRLKVLFTDRQEPRHQFKDVALISLENEDVQQNVQYFIHQKVQRFCEKIPGIPEKTQKGIEQEISMMADGVFLHASLAWANFSQGVTDWSPRMIKIRLAELQKLPSNIESYYCGLLRKIPADFRTKARRAFCWVIGAKTPLSITELQHAVTVEAEHRCWDDLKEDLGYSFESLFQQACGHLLKVGKDGLIVLAHQTVKELLYESSKTAREVDEEILKQYRITSSDIEHVVFSACMTLLQFNDFNENNVERSLVSKRDMMSLGLTRHQSSILKLLQPYPLLAYAVIHWNTAFETDNEHNFSKTLQVYLTSFQANYFRLAAAPWTSTFYISQRPILLIMDLPPLHYCMQCGDFPRTILGLIANGENINGSDEDDLTPLHWAVISCRRNAVAALLTSPRLNLNKAKPGNPKPIHSFPVYGWQDWSIAMMLLEDGRLDVNSPGRLMQTPLHVFLRTWCYMGPALYLVGRDDIDLNAEDETGMTPFLEAFQRSYTEEVVLEMLKNPSVNLNYRARNSQDPLTLAGLWDWRGVESELLRRDVSQAFSISSDRLNYISRFAFTGKKDKLISLLELLKGEGKRMREFECEGGVEKMNPKVYQNQWASTPRPGDLRSTWAPNKSHVPYNLLHLCAQQGWEDVVTILEDQFGLVGLPEGDHVGRTILHWAVQHSWAYALRDHSKKPKTWLNHRDRYGNSALHLASMYHYQEVAQHLIDQGADYLVKDKRGRTPVHVAAETGCRSLLKVLLQKDTLDYGADAQGRSLLHYLVIWQPGYLIADFIRNKSPAIDALDHARRTPLHYSAIYDNVEAAEILLLHHADVNAKDSNRSTPLHYALKESAGMAMLLVKRGGNPRTLGGFHQTCLQIALRSQKSDIIYFILSLIDENPRSRGRGFQSHLFREIARQKNMVNEGELFWRAGSEDTINMIQNQDDFGKQALHRACAAYNFQQGTSSMKDVQVYVRNLVYLNANINAKDKFGYSPVHMAAIGNNLAAMDELLNWSGCDLSLVDRHSCTALDWALAQGQKQMARIMREVGAVQTPQYMEKLRAWQRTPETDPNEKSYKEKDWAITCAGMFSAPGSFHW
ncbi:hypothetical protein MMC22_010450 [Lobaria immixta]|nr:hypothetical protein [Lobaria immixta]